MSQALSKLPDPQAIAAFLQQLLNGQAGEETLDAAGVQELAALMETLALPAGEILFRQGDLGDSLYLVLEGSLEARVQPAGGNEALIGRLHAGDVVGEIALVTGQNRTATITAGEPTLLARLPGAGLLRLAERYPQIIGRLNRQVLQRLRHTQLIGILMDLFGEIDLPATQAIENQLIWKHLGAGEILFRQGDPSGSLYIVISGRLRIVLEDDERGQKILGEVGRGEFTGEFGLITSEPRSATVLAVRDSDVVQLSQELFERLWAGHAQAMLQFTRLIVQRVERFNHSPAVRRPASSAIAVVPVHPAAPVEGFSASLFEALSRLGPALRLSSRSFDELFGRPGAAQTDADHPGAVFIQDWLAEKESQHQYILYQADGTFTPWTRRCLAQADRILLVGEATMDPALGEIEQMAARMSLMARQELILILPRAANRSKDTREWLAPRQVSSHYHIRPDIPQDFQRLVRRLTGKATGLVLGGGGARGLAHVGVIKALEEAGVEIDMIGGTSIGSLFSAGYAYGFTIPEMIDFLKIYSRPEKVLDYTLPFASLTASRKVTDLLRYVFGSTQIEDLFLPYFSVSSNLTRAEPMIHRTGPVWESVRASLAIPGVFTPMPFGADVLVDGGVMNNFPVDIMRELCEGGYVIGVNVSPKQERYKDFSFGSSISGWRVLWDKIKPFGERQKAPSIVASLIRATEINSLYRYRQIEESADLVIEPPVAQFGTLEFDRFTEIIEIGYQAGRQILARLAQDQR